MRSYWIDLVTTKPQDLIEKATKIYNSRLHVGVRSSLCSPGSMLSVPMFPGFHALRPYVPRVLCSLSLCSPGFAMQTNDTSIEKIYKIIKWHKVAQQKRKYTYNKLNNQCMLLTHPYLHI